mmetsp:Transcript_44942/g.82084  ORF Transcript_44942/g.82084 Transcript_44942/m.82084 type:complete len:312 (-) Transcript_44942:702-1637(-)
MVELWQDLQTAIPHSPHRLCSQFIAPHPPLLLQVRFYDILGSGAQTQSHRVRILAYPQAFGLQCLFHRHTCLKSVLPRELSALAVDGSILGKHVDLVKLVASTKLKIVAVMSWGNLHTTCAKVFVHIAVGHHNHLAVRKERMLQLFSMIFSVSRVLRMHSHSHIAQHRLQTSGRHSEAIGFGPLQHVLELAQHAHLHFPRESRDFYHRLAGNVLVVHLQVRQGCAQVRAPIHQPVIPVDETLIVEPYEGLFHCSAKHWIHGKPLTRPIYTGSNSPELLTDSVAILLLPGPHSFKELLSAQIMACQLLVLIQ